MVDQLPVVQEEKDEARPQRPPVDPATLAHRDLRSGPFWQVIPAFADVDEALSVFADYRLPQLFRLRGMLRGHVSERKYQQAVAVLAEKQAEFAKISAANVITFRMAATGSKPCSLRLVCGSECQPMDSANRPIGRRSGR